MLRKFFQKFDQSPAETVPDVSGLLLTRYCQQVDDQKLQLDPAQLEVLAHLQSLLVDLVSAELNGQSSCQSLYLYGDVGRGKSMLMALFYDVCPLNQKRRVHFNTFMQEVHAFIYQWRQQNQTDAITALAKQIRSTVRLLCFDEFHVTDIADAMILGRLFGKLFEQGLVVVITSNRHPHQLYQGGLQREQFLFFIDVLEKSAQVIELAANYDYRLKYTSSQQHVYFCPSSDDPSKNTEAMRDFAAQSFRTLSGGAFLQPDFLIVLARELKLKATYQDILYSNFEELCVRPLSAIDYLAIVERFNIIIIVAIPKLGTEQRNEAKRFMTLIDVMYEHTIKLICSAEVPAPELYTEGDGVFEFNRTVSRLIEMQSEHYCQRADLLRSQKNLVK